MAEDIKNPEDEIVSNVTHIDDAKVNKLVKRGHYFSILEAFDVLRIKFSYDTLNQEEARQFMVYIKYLIKNGHSEALRLQCKYIHDKYIKSQGL